jgi:hypothetical protein
MATVGVLMAMCVRVPVCARLGFERRLFDEHAQPHPAHHFIEHVIVPVTQPAVADLHRHVPITQVIPRARETRRIRIPHRRYRLERRDDFHYRSIVRQQQIATAQNDTALEEQPEL